MAAQDIAAALERAETIFRQRPEAALHADSTASARWEGGTRVISAHANGAQVATDMPSELGGSGDQVTPGWLLRAGLASCLATRVVMAAAAAGIELAALAVEATSRSDARGMLGMTNGSGQPVFAGPQDLALRVRIAAPGTAASRLRQLVEESQRVSPTSAAIEAALPIALRIEVESA